MKKLAIAIPLNWAYVYSPFFLSFVQMLMYSMGKVEPHIYTSNASLIDRMREVLADETLGINPDYILWLDADQVYPIDTIVKLARHIDEGHLVVGGVTPDKHTANPMIYKFMNDKGSTAKVRGFDISRGLVKVDAMGFGGVMIHPSVLEKIKTPYFPRPWDDDMGCYIGEDFGFYNKCRQAGIDVWCDTDLHYSHMVAQCVNVNRNPVCQSFETAAEFGGPDKT